MTSRPRLFLVFALLFLLAFGTTTGCGDDVRTINHGGLQPAADTPTQADVDGLEDESSNAE